MTNKIFGLLALSIFVFAFLLASASAATLSTWDFDATSTSASATSSNSNLVASAITVGTGIVTGALTFSANGVTAATTTDGWAELTSADAVTDGDYYQVTITPNTGFNFVLTSINYNGFATDAMDVSIRTSEDNFAADVSTGTIPAATSTQISTSSLKLPVSVTAPITIKIYGFNAALATDDFSIDNLILSGDLVPAEVIQCIADGDANNQLTLDSLDLSVEEGYGEDEEWFILDTVNIETNVDYSGDSDFEMQNIEPKWGLFDRDTGKWIIDDEEKDFDLEGGEDLDVAIQLKLDEDTDKLATGDIVAYVIATGEDEEFTDAATCEYAEQAVTMKSENSLILDSLTYPTSSVQCTEEVLITADIWNIGDEKLKDTYILVNNRDLGLINQKIEVGDVNDFDNTGLTFTFTVPKGIVEKTYPIAFSMYDEDDDIFQVNDDDTVFTVPLGVSGNCGIASPATVSASLASGGQAGSNMVIKAMIKNSGTRQANYTLNAAGYATWASTAAIDTLILTLNAGESKEVTITLAVKSDVSGEQTFNLEVLSGNELAVTQPVSVLVERAPGLLSGITGGAIGSNGTLWLIGFINVILVLAIIMVAVRFMRK